MNDWLAESVRFLLDVQQADGGWAYFSRGESAVEPTATAVAALAGHGGDPAAIQRGLAFILGLQAENGSVRPQPSQALESALGVHAMIVVAALHNDRKPAERMADHILAYKPETAPKSSKIADNPNLIGFTWLPGSYSWIEPTAYCLILLRRLGRADHPRVKEARRMVFDRRVPGGGWNYGNSIVLGKGLEPSEMPTALALLALSDDRSSWQVNQAVKYLRGQASATRHEKSRAGDVRSALSLAWISIALRARGEDVVHPDRFGALLQASRRSSESPWHRAAALMAVAPVEKIPFVIGG